MVSFTFDKHVQHDKEEFPGMFPDANYTIPFPLFVTGWGTLGRKRNKGCGNVWVCNSVREDTSHREIGAAANDCLMSIDLVVSNLPINNDHDINDDIAITNLSSRIVND